MNRVEYYDLLGRPYDASHRADSPLRADCAAVAAEVLRRVHGLDPFWEPKRGGDSYDWRRLFLHSLADMDSHFSKVGDSVSEATIVGDLVVCGLEGFRSPRSVYTLVELDPKTFLTSSEARGVHTVPVGRVVEPGTRVLGVYRRTQ